MSNILAINGWGAQYFGSTDSGSTYNLIEATPLVGAAKIGYDFAVMQNGSYLTRDNYGNLDISTDNGSSYTNLSISNLNYPQGFTVNTDGNIWATSGYWDGMNYNSYIFRSNLSMGTYNFIPIINLSAFGYNQAPYIKIDSSGDIYLLDTNTFTIKKSINGGTSFAQINNGSIFSGMYVTCFTVTSSGNILVVVNTESTTYPTYQYRVYKSTNGGVTFSSYVTITGASEIDSICEVVTLPSATAPSINCKSVSNSIANANVYAKTDTLNLISRATASSHAIVVPSVPIPPSLYFISSNIAGDIEKINENFYYIQKKYNDMVDRLNPYLDRLKNPPMANLSHVNYEDMVRFGRDQGTPIIRAEDLNIDFNLFKNNLLKIGIPNLSPIINPWHDLPIQIAQLPLAPSDLVGSDLLYDGTSTCEISITYEDNSNNEDGFELYEYTDANGWGSKESPIANAELVLTNIPYIPAELITGPEEITPFQNFKYKIRAWNTIGYSNFSNIWSVPVPVLPLTPINLVGNLNISTVTEGLNWTAGSSNEAGYEISQRFMDIWTVPGLTIRGVTFYETPTLNSLPEYDIGGFLLVHSEPVYNYGWRVRAYNGVGYSPYSNTAEYSSLPTPEISWNSFNIVA